MAEVNLQKLSWETIVEYNLANAFAIPVSEVEDTDSIKYKSVATDSYSQSAGLLKDMTENLETLMGNLDAMYGFASSATKLSKNDSEGRAEAYAQLRSLSAGVDTIVRDYKLEDIPLFNGRSFELSYGNGKIGMTLDNLESSDEEALGLAKDGEGAFVTVSYDYLAMMKNATSDIVGLDIAEAYASDVDLSKYPYTGQLEDGDYWVKVTYKGAASDIEIQNMDGSTIEKVSGVDLSGTGQVSVKFNSGVTLELEKDYFETALGGDKYDYDVLGVQSLFAKLKYETNVQHNLDDGTDYELKTSDTVAMNSGSRIAGTTGTLKVGAVTSPVSGSAVEMKSGNYNMKLQYDGEKSSIWIYASDGTLVSTKRNIDLTGEDAFSVDMGTGISITLDPNNFTSEKRNYYSNLTYTRADEASDVFDFDSYLERIQSAIDLVQEQLDVVEEAQEALDSRYSIVQSALKIANSSGSGLTNLLAGSGLDAGSLFGSINSTSSSSSTQVLLSSGSIFAAMQESVASLSDVDPAILAAYYK